jgi:Fe-S cluster assembly iron-binding protein IscA
MVITAAARDFIQALLDEHKVNGVRLVFEGMGCSGHKMGLALDELDKKEITRTVNGIPVAIERRIIKESKKVRLDFQDSKLVMMGTDSCC